MRTDWQFDMTGTRRLKRRWQASDGPHPNLKHIWKSTPWMTHMYYAMPKCTNRWGTLNKYDKQPGKFTLNPITKSSKTDHTNTLRSHIGKRKGCSAERSHPTEPEQGHESDPGI